MVKTVKKIDVLIISEEVKVYIAMRRKRKLTELYPQRAILEESRKSSTLIQANDWIDHSYYEKMVDDSEARNKRMLEKYGPKMPKGKPSTPTEIKAHKIHSIPEY